MSLTTFSRFYYGHTVTADNNLIAFDEGAGEIVAEIPVGSYTATQYAGAVAAAMTGAGSLSYETTFNRSNRTLTISAGSNFELLTASGSVLGTAAFDMMGFSGADRTGADSYTGNATTGKAYSPQFILQDHVASEDWTDAVQGVVNESASGLVEVVRFGQADFVQMNIRYATNIDQGSSPVILNNATGVDDLRDFMRYAITKAPIEYMPSVTDLDTYQSLILESTQESARGLGFKLYEQYSVGLPGYFETRILKWRVI